MKSNFPMRNIFTKRITAIGILCVALTALFPVAPSVAGDTEFSADTIETMGDQEPRRGRIIVGANRVRTEFSMNDETMIQILDMARQEATIINTGDKSYMRRRAPGNAAGSQDAAADPCAGMENLTCRDAGIETVNGRQARKYEISGSGQQAAMQVWIDTERKMPVRQTMPDGSGMELRLLGRDKVSGRSVEKWELTESRGQGQSQTSLQWYDPVLKMNIREERPGGYTRELTNIRVGTQPADLFTIPPGYSEVTMPKGGGQ